MRCSSLIVLSLAIFYATATPIAESNDIVPEDSLFALDDDLAQARQKIDDMTAAGASDADCRKFAEETKKDISTSVSTFQKTITSLPTGQACESQGQDAVKKSIDELNRANKASAVAHVEVTKASSAQVQFGSRTFSSLTEGQCTDFYTSTNYLNAKTRYETAVSVHIKAKGAVEQAEKAKKAAIEAAAKARHKCLCKTKDDHEKAFAAGSSSNAANAKAWNLAHEILCVLDHVNPCRYTGAPVVHRGTITGAVKEAANCATTTAPVKKKELTKYCATEGGVCKCSGNVDVKYGYGSKWTTKKVKCPAGCNNGVFGDPFVGQQKKCYY